MPFLSSFGAELEWDTVDGADEGVAEDGELDDIIDAGRLVTTDLFADPFWSATMDPKDLTFSAFTGGADAGDDEMGAAASSMEPKVTAEVCLTAGMVFRGTVTPSFMETPWPRVLGRRECVA